MNIERRSKCFEHRNSSSEICEVLITNPMTKIDAPEFSRLNLPEAEAICLNGAWFIPAISNLRDHYEKTWEEIGR